MNKRVVIISLVIILLLIFSFIFLLNYKILKNNLIKEFEDKDLIDRNVETTTIVKKSGILCSTLRIYCNKNLEGELGSSNLFNTEESCNDGLDNDNDGKIDYPNDIGCLDANDNNEFGEPMGYLDGIKEENIIFGWSCDPDDFNAVSDIHFYIDGPVGNGRFLGIAKTDVQRESAVGNLCGGNPNHGFSFTIPISYINGNEYIIYAYAINLGTPSNNIELTNSPTIFKSNLVYSGSSYSQIDDYKIKGLTTSADLWSDKNDISNNYAGKIAINFVWDELATYSREFCSDGEIFFVGKCIVSPKYFTYYYLFPGSRCTTSIAIGYKMYEYDTYCFIISDELDRDISEWSQRGLEITAVIYGVPGWFVITDCSKPYDLRSFCATEYSEEYGIFAGMIAKKYNGKISNFVIHNEVNTNTWYDVGCGQGKSCDKDYWITTYSNNYNSAYDKIKAEQPNAKVLISLDHQFDSSFDKLNDDHPTLSGKTFLTEFSKKVGNREWQVAFHPYPKNLSSNEISFNDFPYVTFGNIGMLSGWLRQTFPDKPFAWNIQITEAGINSLSPSSPEKQSLTLCSAFRNILATPGIESFLYHRMKDHPDETRWGLGFGLRNADDSAKPSWEVWASANRKDVNQLSCGFEDLPYTRLKRGYNPNKGHIVSSRILPNYFNIEWNNVGLLRNQVDDSTMLYECLVGQHTLITKESNCEGLTPMGPVGYILNTQKQNTIPLWRCSINNGVDHFVSKNSNCEGQQNELFLGYAYVI